MPVTIEIPGQGTVEFPDAMSQEDIESALARNLGEPTGSQGSQSLDVPPLADQLRPAISGYGSGMAVPPVPSVEPAGVSAFDRAMMAMGRGAEDRQFTSDTLPPSETGRLTQSVIGAFPKVTGQDVQGFMSTMARAGAQSEAAQFPDAPFNREVLSSPAFDPLAAEPEAGTVAKAGAGVQQSVSQMAEFFMSPLGIATMGMGALPTAAQRAVSLYFAGTMAHSAPEIAAELSTAIVEKDPERIAKSTADALQTLGFTTLAGKHALGPGKPTPAELVARAMEQDVAARPFRQDVDLEAIAALNRGRVQPVEATARRVEGILPATAEALRKQAQLDKGGANIVELTPEQKAEVQRESDTQGKAAEAKPTQAGSVVAAQPEGAAAAAPGAGAAGGGERLAGGAGLTPQQGVRAPAEALAGAQASGRVLTPPKAPVEEKPADLQSTLADLGAAIESLRAQLTAERPAAITSPETPATGRGAEYPPKTSVSEGQTASATLPAGTPAFRKVTLSGVTTEGEPYHITDAGVYRREQGKWYWTKDDQRLEVTKASDIAALEAASPTKSPAPVSKPGPKSLAGVPPSQKRIGGTIAQSSETTTPAAKPLSPSPTAKPAETAAESPAGKPSPAPAKQPWEMSQSDYVEQEWRKYQSDRGYSERQAKLAAKKRHKIEVVAAVEEGKTVPTEVSSQYPEAKPLWQKRRSDVVPRLREEFSGDAERNLRVISEVEARHKAAIEQALREGKPVPAEVLADYHLQQLAAPAKAPEAKKASPRKDAAEFRKLVLEYGPQRGWVTEPERTLDLTLSAQSGLGASVKAKVHQNKLVQQAERRAFSELGLPVQDASNPEAKAAALPKLRELVEREHKTPERQTAEFEKATESGKEAVSTSDLGVGDVLDIEGEKVSVTAVDPDTGTVTLDDGRRFGRQTKEDGQTLYVEAVQKAETSTEFVPEKPAQPKLGQGQNQGDLIASTQKEDFALVGEQAVDVERVQRERAAKEQAERERKEFEAKNQGDLFAPSERAAEGKNIVGMGGAVPSEFEASFRTSTGIKKAAVAEARAERDLPPIDAPARESQEAVAERVRERLYSNPEEFDALVEELISTPRPITPEEVLMLDTRYVDLQAEYAKAKRDAELAEADMRTEDVLDAKRRIDFWDAKLATFEKAVRATGTFWGRAGAMMQRRMRADYTLEAMEARARRAKGDQPLDDAERAEIKTLHDQITAAESKLKEREERIRQMEVQREFDRAKAQAAALPYDKRVLNYAETIVKKMENAAIPAAQRLREKLARMSAGVDPTILADAAVIGSAKIARKGLDFARFADEMVREFGEKLRPMMRDIWDESNRVLDAGLAKAPAEVKKVVRKADVGERIDAAKEGIESKFAKGEQSEIFPLVQKLHRAIVERNPKITLDALVDEVHEFLKELSPEITRLEAMDAISGRGQFSLLPQDFISKTVRDHKTQLRLIGHQMDVEAKRPLPRTGLQRDAMSDAARREQQRLEELKRKFGVVVTDPAAQLASALQARKTYYTHRLADLREEIKTRERIVKGKTPPPSDAALEKLRAEYEAVKREHAEIFGQRELMPEQRLKLALATAERNAKEWEQRLADARKGVFSKPEVQGPKLSSAAIEAVKARTEAIKAEVEHLRDIDETLAANRAAASIAVEKKALEKRISELEGRLSAGDIQPAGQRMNRPLRPELEPLRQQLDALNRQLAEARKKPEAQRIAEQLARRVEALNKLIAEREAKIAAGDISTKPKQVNRPLPPGLEQARQRLDELNRQLAEMRHPKKSKVELTLQAAKVRTAKRLAELTDKMARNDFSRRPKTKLPHDPELMRLKGDLEKVQETFRAREEQFKYDQLNVFRKGLKRAVNLYDAARLLMTTGEFSFVLRQGKFFAASRPLTTARAIPEMLRAFRSERNARASELEIREHPDYEASQEAKLHISREGDSLSRQEELIMGRYSNLVPGIRAFNRAAVTFLNRLRWDSWQAMRKTMPKMGRPTLEEDRMYARMANEATGRGELPGFEGAAVPLGRVLFAPRYLASRIELATGHALWGGSRRSRAVIATEYVRHLIGMTLYYSLLYQAFKLLKDDEDKVKLSFDPRSADFGKIVVNNTRIDPLAGVAQIATFAGRTYTGQTKSTMSGKVTPLRPMEVDGKKVKPGFGQTTWEDVLWRFERSKLHPLLSSTINYLNGVDFTGNETSLATETGKLIGPITYIDIYRAMRAEGLPEGTAMAILAFLGEGLQTYEPKKKPVAPLPRF